LSEKPKIIYPLVLLWALLGIIFITIGSYSLDLSLGISGTNNDLPLYWTSMLFFGTFFLTTALIIFGSIFLIFGYETFRGRAWAWDAGIIISTIFIVIFGFMLGSITATALLFLNNFSIQTLVTVMVLFLSDLGVIFLITRPSVKIYMKGEIKKE